MTQHQPDTRSDLVPQERIRVVIVDDHPMVVDGLRLALDTPQVQVVGSASTAAQALNLGRDTTPHGVVMDLGLPDGSGIDLTRTLTSAHPPTAILVLTMADDGRTAAAAMAAGASGYSVKGATREEVIRAVHAVADGQVILSAAVAAAFRSTPVSTPSPFPELTDRERDVLDLLACGLGNPAIGRRLGITTKTTANHVSNILSKLGLADRTQAALLAAQHPRHSLKSTPRNTPEEDR